MPRRKRRHGPAYLTAPPRPGDLPPDDPTPLGPPTGTIPRTQPIPPIHPGDGPRPYNVNAQPIEVLNPDSDDIVTQYMLYLQHGMMHPSLAAQLGLYDQPEPEPIEQQRMPGPRGFRGY